MLHDLAHIWNIKMLPLTEVKSRIVVTKAGENRGVEWGEELINGY